MRGVKAYRKAEAAAWAEWTRKCVFYDAVKMDGLITTGAFFKMAVIWQEDYRKAVRRARRKLKL